MNIFFKTTNSYVWGHQIVAALKTTIETLRGLIQRVSSFVYHYFKGQPEQYTAVPLKEKVVEPLEIKAETVDKLPWKPRVLAVDAAMRKMHKNSVKAITEHLQRDPCSPYALVKEAVPPLPFLLNCKKKSPLICKHDIASAQGPRFSMEDAHFFEKIEQGIIAGVLDGHDGDQVAKYVSGIFAKTFSQCLLELKGNVHAAFEQCIDNIHQIAMKKDHGGSAAVFCFIELNTRRIYTATIGDCEANIYRKYGKQFKSIPLSCVRDWKSSKEAQRAATILKNPEIAEFWPQVGNPKSLRYPLPNCGINLSRSFADKIYSPGVIHKPKISINKVRSGDVLILACDGLKDFVKESEIIQQLDDHDFSAKKLINYALKTTGDNVTVMAISVFQKRN